MVHSDNSNTCFLHSAMYLDVNMIQVLLTAGSALSAPPTPYISPHQATVLVHLTGLSLPPGKSNYGAALRCLAFLTVLREEVE